MKLMWILINIYISFLFFAGAIPPQPLPLPPNRGFQLQCTDDFAYADQADPQLLNQFRANAPPGYDAVSVEPCIYPGRNAHRFLVKYTSNVHRRCEEIKLVYNDMNNYKPQNCVIGSIAVVPGGFLVEYTRFCMCSRRSQRRRRRSLWWMGSDLETSTSSCSQDCEGRDLRCEFQI